MIAFLLNHIPRPVLQRAAGLAMPLARIWYAFGRGRKQDGKKWRTKKTERKKNGARKNGVECPLCGARYRRFMPYGYVSVRKNALCPKCLALERHRLLWLWLTRETDLLPRAINDLSSKAGSRKARDGAGRGVYSGVNDEHGNKRNAANAGLSRQMPDFLHIAPEVCLMKKFEKIFDNTDGVSRVGQKRDRSEYDTHTFPRNVSRSYGTWSSDLNDTTTKPTSGYITADLESPLAEVHFDVQAIPFTDSTFDVIFCNHVLEHVPDDRLAMREMYRVMKPGGWGVMLSPVDETRAKTFEDDSITDPAERTRIFGQYDHRRIYGRDYADRLRETGWKVEEIDYLATLTAEEKRLYALRPETLYVVKK